MFFHFRISVCLVSSTANRSAASPPSTRAHFIRWASAFRCVFILFSFACSPSRILLLFVDFVRSQWQARCVFGRCELVSLCARTQNQTRVRFNSFSYCFRRMEIMCLLCNETQLRCNIISTLHSNDKCFTPAVAAHFSIRPPLESDEQGRNDEPPTSRWLNWAPRCWRKLRAMAVLAISVNEDDLLPIESTVLIGPQIGSGVIHGTTQYLTNSHSV